jgi:tetratricopeptide (TPR) repeat protein
MNGPSITIATSIPPAQPRRNAGRAMNGDYQALCIRSWLECGFRIVSVNHAEEIPELQAHYPDVSFISTDRDASSISGRRTPYIADLLGALIQTEAPIVGIINSDIVIEPSAAWHGWLATAARDSLVLGQRYDATSLFDGTFRKYYWGFDFFVFSRNAARELLECAMPFAMGLAWWDYWLPTALSLRGRSIVVLDRPAVAHLIHKEPSLDHSWRAFAIRFAEFVVRQTANHRGALPPAVRAILSTCTDLADMPELRWRNRGADDTISRIAEQFVPAITAHLESLPDASPTQSSASDGIDTRRVFDRFAERLAAGEALERAKRLERDGRTAEANKEFQYALDRTPTDSDVLRAFGEFRLRHGEAQSAADMFRVLTECDPDDLWAQLNLAVALHQSNRRTEAITVVENAIARWPECDEARELLRRIQT